MNTNINPESFDIHHVWWPKYDYKSRSDKRFRRYTGFVVPALRINHDLLHYRLTAPPKPSKAQMTDCLDILESLPDAMKIEKLWALQTSVEFFRSQMQFDDEAFRARRIAENLESQIGYLSMKLVDSNQVALLA